MRTKLWIVLNRSGVVRIAKKRSPALYQSERSICLWIDVPDSVFNMPAMVAELEIQEHQVVQPKVEIQAMEAKP